MDFQQDLAAMSTACRLYPTTGMHLITNITPNIDQPYRSILTHGQHREHGVNTTPLGLSGVGLFFKVFCAQHPRLDFKLKSVIFPQAASSGVMLQTHMLSDTSVVWENKSTITK